MMKSKPSFFYEKKIGGIILGIDEAGRGCIVGPVVAAGIILNNKIDISEINDSKKLSTKKREEVYRYLISHCYYITASSSVEEIDRLNILQASLLAMRRVIRKTKQNFDHILVDGNVNPDVSDHNIINLVKGDSKSLTVAAASIIAKVTRDKIMENLDNEFPQYHWKQNKGYGTSKHYHTIKEYGVCIHHRKSFLKKILPQK